MTMGEVVTEKCGSQIVQGENDSPARRRHASHRQQAEGDDGNRRELEAPAAPVPLSER